MRKRRDKHEIYYDILKTCKRCPMSCNRIAGTLHGHTTSTHTTINKLVDSGCLRKANDKPIRYLTTAKGLDYIEKFQKILELLSHAQPS